MMPGSGFKMILLVFMLFYVSHSYSQVREIQSFNNNWEFLLGEFELAELTQTDLSWQEIKIPHTWNSKDIQSGEKVNYTTAWYRKNFKVNPAQKDRQYFLRFEGVGQYAEVFVNEKSVGDHLGSYSAFAFNITDFIRQDTINSIHVKVNNELNASYPKDNFLFGIYGGIYRDVSLIITGDCHIGLTDHASPGVYVHPKEVSREAAVLKLVVLVKNELSRRQKLSIINQLIDNNSVVVAENRKDEVFFPGGMKHSVSILEVNEPRLWNGRIDPFLYQLKTQIMIDGEVVDEMIQPYGIRFFDIDPDKGFILNGEPYRLYGVCRHQEWEDLGNALLPEHHRRDMEFINELGATSIRLAHYQQAEYIYDLADSLGILVWAEIPFINGYNEGADGNALQQMTELIKQNFSHPSIFVWGVHNEVIKGDVVQEPVNLTRDLHKLSKDLDPSRYTVAVSNIWWLYDHPIHENTDLQGFNQYTGWYGGNPQGLGNWIHKYHDAKPDVRFSVSEYGAGGNIAHQSNDHISVPKPTGQFFPEGYHTYYHEITWNAIENASFIWASYIWNMFDFSVPEWDRGGIKGRNHKGLITYDRETKKDAFYWYKAIWSEDPVLHLTGKRNNKIKSDTIRFKAYCNYGLPRFYINGEYKGMMEAGINKVQFLSPQMILEPGKYEIEVRAAYHSEIYQDSFEFEVVR
ncbi:MAG: beta-galactosidase [Bacteroidetes bacterium]|nr:beta-galactosidase [Bacteroidota bacterium]